MILSSPACFYFSGRAVRLAVALCAFLLAATGPASTQPQAPAAITVFAPGMAGAGLGKIIAVWSARTGNRVTVVGGSLGAVESAMAAQPGDLVILPVDALSRHTAMLAGVAIPIGRIPFALAVAKGAPHPDISTETKFRAALNGQTVAYNDPAGGSIAGVMVEKILRGPGYAAVHQLPLPGNATMAVGDGRASMVVGVMPEILQVPGAEAVGLVPAALDLHIDLGGAVTAKAARPDLARDFLAYLAGPEAKAVWAANGIAMQ
jgi:molybdate transport system substrate-binding protein